MNIPKGKLFALVAVFAAIGLVTATGAFTTVTAERTASVTVAGDQSALVALGPYEGGGPQSNSEDYLADEGSGSELEIDMSGGTGSGVNLDATTSAENVFNITNQGTQAVVITLTVDDDDSPSEAGAVAFGVPTDTSGYKIVKPTNSNVVNNDAGFGNQDVAFISSTGSADYSNHGIYLDTGETVTVSMFIDTSDGNPGNALHADATSPGDLSDDNTDDLIDSITIHADADIADGQNYAYKYQKKSQQSP